MNRRTTVHRKTQETDITIDIDLDGTGNGDVETGIGFYDHLLQSLAHHALFDLKVRAVGDLDVDDHHSAEDTALVLGEAIDAALGDRAGIQRFGEASVPMDEAIATAVVDCGGRPYAVIDLEFGTPAIGTLSTQMIPHVLESLARTGGLTLHIQGSGRIDHHVAEASFKALARALSWAVALDPRRSGVPSTKGTL